MESRFQMDFILGNKKSESKNDATTSSKTFDFSDDNMLPDSSLSPSQIFDKTMVQDCDNKVTVYDRYGNQFYVYEKNLLNESDISVASPDSIKRKSYQKLTQPNSIKIESDIHNVIDTNEEIIDKMSAEYDEVSDNESLKEITEAAHLAYIECRIGEIEKELSKLSGNPLAVLINSANNLQILEFDQFELKDLRGNLNAQYSNDPKTNLSFAFSESDEIDRSRKLRMKDIYDRFNEINKWVRSYKRKMSQIEKLQSNVVTDFSSLPTTNLPYPNIIHNSVVCDDTNNNGSKNDTSTNDNNCSCLCDNNNNRSDLVERDNSFKANSELNTDSVFHTKEEEHLVEFKKSSNSQNPKSHRDQHRHKQYSKRHKHNRQHHHNHHRNSSAIINNPSAMVIDRNPPTPDLRRAELDSNDISEGIRVLLLQQNYLRAGTIIQPISTPDNPDNSEHSACVSHKQGDNHKIWRVRLDSGCGKTDADKQRRRQDVIVLSEWQLLEQGVREVIPTSTSQLCIGTRVCANWSQQLPLNLYPGTVARPDSSCKSTSSSSSSSSSSSVSKCCSTHNTSDDNKNDIGDCNDESDTSKSSFLPIQFDDGDHKEIPLTRVRLLPENFPNLHELMLQSPASAVDMLYACERDLRKQTRSNISINNNNNVNDNDNDRMNDNVKDSYEKSNNNQNNDNSKNKKSVMSKAIIFPRKPIKKPSGIQKNIKKRLKMIDKSSRKSKLKPKSESVSKALKLAKEKKKIQWKLIKNESTSDSASSNPPCLQRNIDALTITCDDDVQLLSYSRYSVYVARVQEILCRKQAPEMNLRLQWYYHLNDCIVQNNNSHDDGISVAGCYGLESTMGTGADRNKSLVKRMKKSRLAKYLLFQTSHRDVNDVYSIVGKITVMSFDEFYNHYLIDKNYNTTTTHNKQSNITSSFSKSGLSSSFISGSSLQVPDNIFILAGHYNQQSKSFQHLTPALMHYLHKIEKI